MAVPRIAPRDPSTERAEFYGISFILPMTESHCVILSRERNAGGEGPPPGLEGGRSRPHRAARSLDRMRASPVRAAHGFRGAGARRRTPVQPRSSAGVWPRWTG